MRNFWTKKHKKFILISIFLVFLLLSLASFVFAQRQVEVQYPEIGSWKPTEITKDILPNYIKYIFNFSVGISGAIAFAVLIYGGFRYLISRSSATAMADAKERIGAAILGLLIIFGSY